MLLGVPESSRPARWAERQLSSTSWSQPSSCRPRKGTGRECWVSAGKPFGWLFVGTSRAKQSKGDLDEPARNPCSNLAASSCPSPRAKCGLDQIELAPMGFNRAATVATRTATSKPKRALPARPRPSANSSRTPVMSAASGQGPALDEPRASVGVGASPQQRLQPLETRPTRTLPISALRPISSTRPRRGPSAPLPFEHDTENPRIGGDVCPRQGRADQPDNGPQRSLDLGPALGPTRGFPIIQSYVNQASRPAVWLFRAHSEFAVNVTYRSRSSVAPALSIC